MITDGESILSKPPLHDPDSFSPCNHEEADSRMLLHANHAAWSAEHTDQDVDTDVVVCTNPGPRV